MAHKSTNTFRFSDIGGEPLRRLPPIRGFENETLVSLEEATRPLIGLVQEIENMVYNIRQSKIQAKNGLTIDESSSIALYSMEWSPREQSFYNYLNKTLRDPKRESLLPPWLKFLRIFFTGLSKLPSTGHRTIYRGVKLDLRSKYKLGERVVWWGFSSCTQDVAVLENEQFFGKSGTRTLFAIESDTGKNIRQHSFYQHEDEIVLLPGREFEVVSSTDMGNQLTMIELKEVEPRYPTIASLPTSTSPVEVSYENKRITDNDIPRVIKEALQQQQCTILDLSFNRITHEGAALLSTALKHNEVSDSLNISTTGEGKQNWQRKRTIEFDQWTHQSEDRTSISLSELIVLSFVNEQAPYCLVDHTSIRDVRCLKTNFLSFRLLDEFE